MKAKIKLRRGAAASVPTLSTGEIGFSTDTKDIYVGSSSGNAKFLNSSKTVTNVKYDSETGKVIKTIDGTDYDAFDLSELAEHDYPGVYNSYLTKKASGDIVHIEDGAEDAPLKGFEFSMEPVQDLHGQASPYPEDGGKNKLPLFASLTSVKNNNGGATWSGNSATLNGVTFTCNFDSNGRLSTVSTSGTATANATFTIGRFQVENFSGMILNGAPGSGGDLDIQLTTSPWTNFATDTGSGATIASGSGEVILFISFLSGTNTNGKVFKPMIREATEADATFAPYSNICPISGYTKIDITRTGENILPQLAVEGTANGVTFTPTEDGGVRVHGTSSASFTRGVSGRFVSNGEPFYVLYAPTVTNVRYSVYDVTAEIAIPEATSYANITGLEFTAPKGHEIVLACVFSNGVSVDFTFIPAFCFIAGKEAKPYNGAIYPVTWADEGTVYKGSGKYLGAGKWEITATWKSVSIPSLDWNYVESWHDTNLFYVGQLILSDMKYVANGKVAISSIYPWATQADFGDKRMYVNSTYIGSNKTIGISDERYTSAADFKAAMDGQTILYELETPTTFIVDGPNPATIKGENFIWNDISFTNLEYRVQPEAAFDSKADKDGDEIELTSGTSRELLSKGYTEESVPYNFRATPIDSERVRQSIVGGTIAWNQLVKTTRTTAQEQAGLTVTKVADGEYSIVGTATNINVNVWLAGGYQSSTPLFSVPKDHVFLIKDCNVYEQNAGYNFMTYLGSTAVLSKTNKDYVITAVRVPNTVVGTAYNLTIHPQFFDLTQMFGPTVADYIYGLETTTPGAGVAYFRSLFPKPYYDYNAGELMSVKTSAHNMTGKNLLDPTAWGDSFTIAEVTFTRVSKGHYKANGTVSNTTWIPFMGNSNIVLINAPKGEVCFSCGNTKVRLYLYTSNSDFVNGLGTVASSDIIGFRALLTQGGVFNNDDLYFQLEVGSTASPYEPYELHSYALDEGLELRGVPKLDANNALYYDGDIYEADGKVTRKYYAVDLGTLSWGKGGGGNLVFITNSLTTGSHKAKGAAWSSGVLNGITSNGAYTAIRGSDVYNHIYDMTMGMASDGMFYIYDAAKENLTAVEFKTAMSGVYLVYELATSTTEFAKPFKDIQIVDPYGTEEFVDEREVAVPVGHNSKYYKPLRAKLEELSEIPSPPTSNGTYRLKVVVSGGTPTYSWEAV